MILGDLQFEKKERKKIFVAIVKHVETKNIFLKIEYEKKCLWLWSFFSLFKLFSSLLCIVSLFLPFFGHFYLSSLLNISPLLSFYLFTFLPFLPFCLFAIFTFLPLFILCQFYLSAIFTFFTFLIFYHFRHFYLSVIFTLFIFLSFLPFSSFLPFWNFYIFTIFTFKRKQWILWMYPIRFLSSFGLLQQNPSNQDRFSMHSFFY